MNTLLLLLVLFATVPFNEATAKTSAKGFQIEELANNLVGERLLQKIDQNEFCLKAAPLEAKLRAQGKNAKKDIPLRGFFNLFNQVEKCPRIEVT
jgi:hypothetical protein